MTPQPRPRDSDDISALDDRRAAERLPCARRCRVLPDGPSGRHVRVGYLLDLSRAGAALLLADGLPLGSLLTLSPAGSGLGAAPVARARVVRAEPRAWGWLHGCAFVEPLSEGDAWLWAPHPDG